MRAVMRPVLLAGVAFAATLSLVTLDGHGGVSGDPIDLKPWARVGGCGAGGSGGGAGDGIRWIGQGVSGGLVDLEVLPRYAVGQNFQTFTVAPRFSYRLGWSRQLGISIPFVSKQAEVQFRSNQAAYDRTTGGLGDLSIDLSQSFGPAAQYGLNLALALPTGQYDIVRGPDAAKEFLPSSLQKGSGLYNFTAGLSYTRDVDRGMWLGDFSWHFPFNSHWISGKNEFMDSWLSDYQGVNSRRFYYDWKWYGENDLGDFTPQSLSWSLYYAYRGSPGMVYSYGVTFGVPLGVAWIRSEKAGVYDPRPDPDHKAWSAAFVYGMEFSRDQYPLYVSFSLPLHDKANAPGEDEYDPSPMEQWDGPDWDDFLQQWVIAFGYKTTFF